MPACKRMDVPFSCQMVCRLWAGVFKPAGLSAVTQRAPPSSSEQTASLPSFVRCQVGLEAGNMASLTVIPCN